MKKNFFLAFAFALIAVLLLGAKKTYACGANDEGLCRWNECGNYEDEIPGFCFPGWVCCGNPNQNTCAEAGGTCNWGACNGDWQELELPGCPIHFSCCYLPESEQHLPLATWESYLLPGLPAGSTFGTVINKFLTYFFPIAGIILLAYLIFGGFSYLTSLGDPKRIQSARLTITYALVGFAILIGAYWVVLVAARILNIPAINQIFR